jgi:hypothetical protein
VTYDYRGARDRIFGIVRDEEGKVKELVQTALTMSERVLLLALVEFAPNIEPSTASLAAMCGTDERSIRRLLRSSVAKGFLTVEHRNGKRSRYTLTRNPGFSVPPDAESPLTLSPPTPDAEPSPPRTLSPPKQTTKADKEAGKKSVRANARRKPSKVEAPLTPEEAADHANITKLYFERFEARRGHKPVFDGQDGKAVKDLLAKCGPEDAAKAINDGFASWWGDKITIRDVAKNPAKFIGLKPDNGRGRTPVQNNNVDVFAGVRSL